MNNLVKIWAKVLNRHLTKDIQMANKHIKNAPHHMSSGRQNNNESLLRYIHIKRPRSKTLTLLNTGEDVEQPELSCTAGRNTKWHSCFRQFGYFLQNQTYSYHNPVVVLCISQCSPEKRKQ